MSAIRMVFLTVAALLSLGIWLTGFEHVHWLLWLPVPLLVMAGLTGFCPGLIVWNKLGFPNRPLTFGCPKDD